MPKRSRTSAPAAAAAAADGDDDFGGGNEPAVEPPPQPPHPNDLYYSSSDGEETEQISDSEAEEEEQHDAAEDKLVYALAQNHVRLTAKLRELNAATKGIKEAKSENYDALLEAFEDVSYETLELPCGTRVSCVDSKRTEPVTDQLLSRSLETYLSKHDKASATARTRARDASRFVFQSRPVTVVKRIAVKAPPKPKCAIAKPASKKKQRR
jgi:hypothetical protein